MTTSDFKPPLRNDISLNKALDLYKYCDFNTACIIINHGTLKFTHPRDFNDPFDCDENLLHYDIKEAEGRALDDILKLKQKFPAASDEDITKGFILHQKDKIKRCSVTCFSLNFKNTLMWSYYADKHRGITLQFNGLRQDSLIGIPGNTIMQGPVDYDSLPINYCKDKIAGLKRLFLSKSADWRHEEEFRFLFLKEPITYKFHKDFLTGVYFGIKSPEYQKRCFMDLCKDAGFTHIRFYQAIKNMQQIGIRPLMKG